MSQIVPAILVHNFEDLKAEIEFLERHGVKRIQIDVMDGKFVPNSTIGAEEIGKIKTNLMLEAHLMIENPITQLENFYRAGCKILTVHYEACRDGGQRTEDEQRRTEGKIQEIIEAGKKLGAQIGVAINPETPIDVIKKFLDKIDLLLIMSVHPGFGGQEFIPETLEKIRTAKNWIGPSAKIEVDGGINLENIKEIKNAGADLLIAGSGIFLTEDPVQTLRKLKSAID